jgi:hypothetical protein
MLAPPPPDHRPRGPRWPMRIPVVVELFRADPPVAPLRGETVNLSLEGVEIRLPVRLPVESRVHVTLEGAAMRSGSVRWTKLAEVSGVLHGVELHAPIEHRAPHARPLRRLRRRQFLRRLGFALVGLVLIAITTAGLVWLMEAFRNYNPKYYEPKDFERERYEIQRRSGGSP